MIARNSLYTFIEDLIDNAGTESALYEAMSFRNVRGSIDESTKVVRVECFTGEFVLSTEAKRSEAKVESSIQCYVTPSGLEETDLDAAIDLSFDMAKEIHDAIAGDPGLNGSLCDAQFRNFATGFGNLGATRRGVTEMEGLINQAI